MPASPFAPLRHIQFRRFWLSGQVSNFGSFVQGVAAAWLMTSLTTDPRMTALVQASTSLPVMLFSLPAGALADSIDRRRVMLAAQIVMLTASGGLCLATLAGGLTPWRLLMFTFAIGIGTALNNPSWQASVGDLVPAGEVPEAVSMNSMGLNMMRAVGPAVGGALVASVGAAAAFLVNALSYLPLTWVLLLWRPKTPPSSLPRESFPMAVAAGLRYVALSPNLIRVLLRAFIFGLGAISGLALLPLTARDLLGGGVVTYGMLLGAFGLGAIAGGAANSHVRRALRGEGVIRLSFAGFALAIGALGLGHSLWSALPAAALAGASWVLALSLLNVTTQLSSPRWVVGRALALYQVASFGGMTAGSWIWGAVAARLGIPSALGIAMLVLGLGAAMGWMLPLPDFGAQDLRPMDRFRTPALQLDLRGRSGPILVMIDYRIDPADIPDFLETMRQRRRMRRRDGARQWSLLRDLEHPETWTESYHVATWDDYLRHNMRRTVADSEIADRLVRLHRGPEAPHIHRLIERQNIGAAGDFGHLSTAGNDRVRRGS